jgi:hypothetical protein
LRPLYLPAFLAMALPLSLFDELALELSHSAQEIELRYGGVITGKQESLLQEANGDLLLVKVIHQALEVSQVARQAVHRTNDQSVLLSKVLEKGLELGSGHCFATDLVAVDFNLFGKASLL